MKYMKLILYLFLLKIFILLGYGTWLCFFLWKDMIEIYDRNDESRKMISFQKIDTLT